ncbi:recombination regulator RecX [Clostridium amazonitimonense]|uniref:recombination regulator RecX n=1 Tax=Clostridium amazonitimonense TaxID=1499689 RepID=UPI000509BA96|nr:recombination regulator RecX [Clostridium amazonitimonense]
MEGKITSIEIQSRNKDRVNIFVDGEFAIACFAEIVYRKNLKKGDKIDISQLNEISLKEEYSKAKNYALRLVEKGYKPEKNVVDKLLQRGYSKDTINEVIIFLKEYSLIDDKRYAEAYVKEKSNSQGKNKIRYALLNKGIDKNIIENAIENLYDEEMGENIAEKVAIKKYNAIIQRENDKYKIKMKLYRFLIGKGYSMDCSKSVVDKVLQENEL